jgi:hypothetical protein
MMRNIVKAASVFSLVALAACGASFWNQGNAAWVNLSGGEEVPMVSTNAFGNGRFIVEHDGAISGSVATTGVQGTAAHIHMGARGENGPVAIPLTKSGDTYSAAAGAKLNPEQLAAFTHGKLYVNVHSAAHKGGEIRGQLRW